MKENDIINYFESLKYPENLSQVIITGITEAKKSSRIGVHKNESFEGENLTSEHYYSIYALRIRNSNGIAKNTMGMSESLENFKQHAGPLELILLELDEGASVSVWLSCDKKIVACLFHPKGSDMRLHNKS